MVWLYRVLMPKVHRRSPRGDEDSGSENEAFKSTVRPLSISII